MLFREKRSAQDQKADQQNGGSHLPKRSIGGHVRIKE